jgi:anti-anti-sigma factor
MQMTTSIREVADVTVVDISGRIVLGDESAALRDLVRHLLSMGHKKILFNLANVNHIDSAGLGHLVLCFHERAETGGRTEAAQPHERSSRSDRNYKAVHRLRHHGRRGRGR